jgi:glutamate--cysteine ligase
VDRENTAVKRLFERRLNALTAAGDGSPLQCGLRGMEKESLRVTPEGFIAPTDHPRALGSALTNRYITTDYSEALIEFITPPERSTAAALGFLADIHQFAYQHLGDELLWALSMPCRIRSEEDIPIARYGGSNVGTLKTVYRHGLGLRYGRYMQAIAGVHFNYSLPEEFWPVYAQMERRRDHGQAMKSDAYLGLVRNVRRLDWLLLYLFGASPAVCKCFLRDDPRGLESFGAATYYAPHATSLRMSDLGYKNTSQAELHISANSLEEYIRDLTHAIRTPHPAYERLGVVVDGDYRQLNANQLQIENEYYSTIRPKRSALSGERPTAALRRGGIEYVELRALDVSPFHPAGVGEAALLFAEVFLVYCVLLDSRPVSRAEQLELDANHVAVARRGREPGLRLRRHGAEVAMVDWAREVLDGMLGVAEALDRGTAGGYADVVRESAARIEDPDRTPSARLLQELRAGGCSLAEYGLEISRRIADVYRAMNPGDNLHAAELRRESVDSLQRQNWIETHEQMPFDQYLAEYYG